MQKKLTRKEKISQQKAASQNAPEKKQSSAGSSSRKLQQSLALIIAIIAFAIYANTLNHQYVLDDFGLMPENSLTKKGIHGLGEIFSTTYRTGYIADNQVYRPLSKAMFAVEWQLAPNKPAMGHWMNVILYAVSCMLLFRVFSLYLKGKLLVPFITALLFAAHPLHTEVVANIKSRDEILCLLFNLLTAFYFYKYITLTKFKYLFYSSLTFFLALMSKELAITWLAVFPLFIYFFTEAKKVQYWNVIVALVIPTVIFLLIRNQIVGSYAPPIPLMDNYLVGIKSILEQKTTAIFLMGIYLKLLFFPHPLCIDGSYNHFPAVGPGDWKFLLPFVIYCAIAVYAILRFKKKDLISFGIIYFFITVSVVSNVIVMLGTNYGERLMYIPSLGFCFCIAILLERIFKAGTPLSKISLAVFFQTYAKPIMTTSVVVILFSVKTIARNADWYDNTKIYYQDIQTAPNSAHLQLYMAIHLSSSESLDLLPDSAARHKQLLAAIERSTNCIQIYPGYADAYQQRGYQYYLMNEDSIAEVNFKKSLELNNTNSLTHEQYGGMLFRDNRFAEAKVQCELALGYNPMSSSAANNLGSVYGVFGEYELRQANEDPANRDQHLAEAKRQLELSVSCFLKAIKIDPGFRDAYRQVSMSYRSLGDQANANRYEAMLKQMEMNNK